MGITKETSNAFQFGVFIRFPSNKCIVIMSNVIFFIALEIALSAFDPFMSSTTDTQRCHVVI